MRHCRPGAAAVGGVLAERRALAQRVQRRVLRRRQREVGTGLRSRTPPSSSRAPPRQPRSASRRCCWPRRCTSTAPA